mgnify:FL=1
MWLPIHTCIRGAEKGGSKDLAMRLRYRPMLFSAKGTLEHILAVRTGYSLIIELEPKRKEKNNIIYTLYLLVLQGRSYHSILVVGRMYA